MITHHRKIRAAGNAHSHNGRDLRNAHGAHDRIVAKNAAEIVSVGENIFLQWQEDACRVDEINGGDVILDSDILRANDFFRGHGKKCTGFHRGIIRDNHERAAANFGEAGNRARARRATPLFVHFERRVDAKLEEVRVGISQFRDTLAGRQAALFVLRLDRFRSATLPNLFFLVLNFREQIDHAARVFFEVGGFAICASFQNGSGHARASRNDKRWILIKSTATQSRLTVYEVCRTCANRKPEALRPGHRMANGGYA